MVPSEPFKFDGGPPYITQSCRNCRSPKQCINTYAEIRLYRAGTEVHEAEEARMPEARQPRQLPFCHLLARRKVDVRLPGKGNSNSHDARLVHLIITMIKWIRTSRLMMGG